MLTLLKRELTSMALLAQTYAIAALYIVISGVFLIDLVSTSESADLGSYYSNMAFTLVVLCPILAAFALAEPRSSGALLISLAWPVSRTALVLSKFIAITLYTWLLISICWIYYVQLESMANPDGARVFGGWVGLLLIAAMFNAIALAISSRVASTAAAAFLGFGVLTFFMVLQFLPESVRGLLDQFGPLQHLDPMRRGVIPVADVAYFVVLSAGALGLAVYGVGRRRAGTDRTAQARRVASVGGALAVFLATPVVAGAATGQLDLTAEQRETVSQATEDVIDQVGDVPIEITAFSPETSLAAAELRGVVRKYGAAGANVRERIIDPDASPALALSAGVSDYNTYLLKVGDRTAEIEDLNETTLTSSIAMMAQTDPPIACFTAGHGERSHTNQTPQGLSSFAARLRIAGYEPGQIFLAGKGAQDLLDECAAVIVMGPRSSMTAGELDTLGEYASANGRLIVAADSVSGDIEQLNELITPFGMKLTAGPLRDPQSLADDPAAIVSSNYTTSAAVVDKLSNDDTPVIFANSLGVEPAGPALDPEGPQVVEYLTSSQESYLLDEAGERVPDSKGEHVLAGSVALAENTGEGDDAAQTSSRIAVLGSADVASNEYQNSFGNQEFAIRLLQYVAEDDLIVSAYRDPGANAEFNITGEQRSTLLRQGVVLPTLAALVFVPFVLWRMKRG